MRPVLLHFFLLSCIFIKLVVSRLALYVVENSAAPNGSTQQSSDFQGCADSCAEDSSCYGFGFSASSTCSLNTETWTFVKNVSGSEYYYAVQDNPDTCSVSEVPAQQCDDGWTLTPPQPTSNVASLCVQLAPSSSCATAKSYCAGLDAQLITIATLPASAVFSAYLYQMINTTGFYCMGFEALNTTQVQNGKFTKTSFYWLDGTTWSYTKFGTYQPQNVTGANCGTMYLRTDNLLNSTQWYNRPCTTTQSGGICTKPPNFIYQT